MADYTIKQVSEKSNPWENPKGGTIYYKNVLLEAVGGNANWTAVFSIVGPI